MSTDLARIKSVKAAHEHSLMAKANVVGVGIGYRATASVRTRQLAIIVMVKKKVSRLKLSPDDLIPESIEDIPVDVQEVGEVKAQS
jgi:hypothetical protein